MSAQPHRRRALSVALIGAGVTLALGLLLFKGTDPASGDEGGLPPVASHFSVLGEATEEQVEAQSPAARALLSAEGSSLPVEALGEANYEGDHVLVAVAGGKVCAIDESSEGGGAFCGEPEEAEGGQLVTAGFCLPGLAEGQSRLVGLMPDGVTSVTIASAGEEEEVPVIDNAYVTEVPAEGTTISGVGLEEARLGIELPLEEGAEATGACAATH
jgi:hypothetical protein